MKNFLLAVIAVGVLVIAGVLVYDRLDGDPVRTDAWHDAWESAETSAKLYCTMNGAATTEADLYSDEYKNCVKAEAEAKIKQWERENPDDVWE